MQSLSQWVNVSGQTPCPICGKNDWCSRTLDDRFAACRRIFRWDAQERFDRNKAPYYFYDLRGGGESDWKVHRVAPPPARELINVDLAPIELRDEIYHYTIDQLILSDRHRDDLIERGLTPTNIERNAYRTWPARERIEIARAVFDKFGTDRLKGIPGFYRKDKKSNLWSMTGLSGLMIPVRNESGQIAALRIRPDNPHENAGKYQWISSRSAYGDKVAGPSAGAICHVPAAAKELPSDALWITEGELKADIATQFLEKLVISIPGVLNWERSIDLVRHFSPERVVIALDQDKPLKRMVVQSIESLYSNLSARGIKTSIATW